MNSASEFWCADKGWHVVDEETIPKVYSSEETAYTAVKEIQHGNSQIQIWIYYVSPRDLVFAYSLGGASA